MSLSLHYLPAAHFSEAHSILIDAEPERILSCVERVRPNDDPVIARLIGLREAPARWAGRAGSPEPFGLQNFTPLGRTESELAFGLAGRFWRLDFGLVPFGEPDAFRAFDEPGFAKLVLGFETKRTADGRVRLTTRTRLFCFGSAARLKMVPYWLAIRVASGWIRQRILRLVKTASEAPAPG